MRKTLAAAGSLAALALSACGGGGEKVLYFELEEGQCFRSEDVDAAQVVEIGIVECTEPHDMQVIATQPMSQTEYPGQDALLEEAGAWCQEQAVAWATSAGRTDVDPVWLVPSQEDFETRDATTYSCSVQFPEDVSEAY